MAAVSIEHGLRGNVSAIDVIPAGLVQGATTQYLVQALREHRPGFRAWVTGQADFKAEIAQRLPWAVTLITLATFGLLIPVKALIMNAVSLGATFGTLVWIFQSWRSWSTGARGRSARTSRMARSPRWATAGRSVRPAGRSPG